MLDMAVTEDNVRVCVAVAVAVAVCVPAWHLTFIVCRCLHALVVLVFPHSFFDQLRALPDLKLHHTVPRPTPPFVLYTNAHNARSVGTSFITANIGGTPGHPVQYEALAALQALLLEVDSKLDNSPSVTAWSRGPDRPQWLSAVRGCFPEAHLRPMRSALVKAEPLVPATGASDVATTDKLQLDANLGVSLESLQLRARYTHQALQECLLTMEAAVAEGETAYRRAGAVQDAWGDVRSLWRAAVVNASCASQLAVLLDLFNEECLLWDMISDEGTTVDRSRCVFACSMCPCRGVRLRLCIP